MDLNTESYCSVGSNQSILLCLEEACVKLKNSAARGHICVMHKPGSKQDMHDKHKHTHNQVESCTLRSANQNGFGAPQTMLTCREPKTHNLDRLLLVVFSYSASRTTPTGAGGRGAEPRAAAHIPTPGPVTLGFVVLKFRTVQSIEKRRRKHSQSPS